MAMYFEDVKYFVEAPPDQYGRKTLTVKAAVALTSGYFYQLDSSASFYATTLTTTELLGKKFLVALETQATTGSDAKVMTEGFAEDVYSGSTSWVTGVAAGAVFTMNDTAGVAKTASDTFVTTVANCVGVCISTDAGTTYKLGSIWLFGEQLNPTSS